jgi:dolichyl-phosphate-mannose--protein O-mannosyl transferase
MLDVFLMFWVLAAFGCLLVDRDDGRARLAARLAAPLDAGTGGPSLGWRPWRWAAGLCLGAATATKWDGLFWIPVFLVLAVWWDAGARRTAGADRAVLRALVRDGLPALLPFLVLPAVVYVASWTGWFISDGAHAWDHDRYVHAGQSWFTHDRAVLGGWLRYQWEIWHFHSTLTAGHPYLSEPPGWLLLLRPVSYYYASPHTCGAALCSQEVLGIGTPALWWASIPALVAVLWRAVSRLDWRAGAVLAAFAAGYLPWFWEQHEHRTMFLFYLLPDVPFMVLAVTIALGVLVGSRLASSRRRLIGIVVTGGYLLVAVANFGYLYPVLAAQPIPYSSWHQRMWFQQCDDAKHRDTRTENAPCWI